MRTIDELAKVKVSVECFIFHNNKILLFKRSDDSKVFPGFWSIPGGHVDEGEDVLTAIIREVKEETGIDVSSKNVKLKYHALHNHLDRDEMWIIFGFRVDVDQNYDVVNTHEGDSEWIDLDKLQEMEIFPPVAYYLKHALNAQSGLMYNYSHWEGAKLSKVLSEKLDTDY